MPPVGLTPQQRAKALEYAEKELAKISAGYKSISAQLEAKLYNECTTPVQPPGVLCHRLLPPGQ